MKGTILASILVLFTSLALISQSEGITIDGTIEEEWLKSSSYEIKNLVKNFLSDEGPETSDLSGYFRSMWDNDNLFLLVVVKDDKIFHGILSPDHQNDNIEVYLDINNSKLSLYDGKDDDQIRFIPEVDTINSKRGLQAGQIEFYYTPTDTGYIFEIAFPWNSIAEEEFIPLYGKDIGLDVMITDNDGSAKKDYILAWHSETNNAYQDASLFGTMRLSPDGSMEDMSYLFEPAEHDALDINESKIERVIYVSKANPNASDNNSGNDPDLPLKTIGKALEMACDSAGRGIAIKVLISEGVYREFGLNFIKTGSPALFMNTEIVLEGIEPGKVIISGSELINDNWTLYDNNTYRRSWSYDFKPYLAWNEHGPPLKIGQHREMAFVDSYFMQQVLRMEDLIDNSFFIDTSGGDIYIKVADSIDFINSNKEIALNGDDEELSWPPLRLLSIPADKDKVVLRNLVFQHATMRLSEAALRFYGWKILMENCEIIYSNGHGLTVSSGSKYVKIKNSNIDNNGGCGIFTWGTEDFSCINSSTSDNNWRGHQGGLNSYSLAGIKFHHTRGLQLKNHTAEHNWSPGLWTDLEVLNAVFDSCAIGNNYGPGFLIEISNDITITNSTIYRNIPGIRCHSSRSVTIDNCLLKGNCSQINVYRDYRDFSSSEWTSQFEGRVWDKTPSNWSIRNSHIIAEDDPEWQAWAEDRLPYWMNYENPGYQPFWHFSHADFMKTFFKSANIAYQNNTWVHPVTQTPFRDDKLNPLNLEEWEIWISGIKSMYNFIEILDSMARINDASGLNISMFTNAGFENIESESLPYYKLFVENETAINDEEMIILIINKANSFNSIRNMAQDSDASGLEISMLDDCGLSYNPDLLEDYRMIIATVDDIPDIETLQALLNSVFTKKYEDQGLKLFPNPADDILILEWQADFDMLEIMNINGQTVLRLEVKNNYWTKVNIEDLRSGVYLIRLSGKNSYFNARVVKK